MRAGAWALFMETKSRGDACGSRGAGSRLRGPDSGGPELQQESSVKTPSLIINALPEFLCRRKSKYQLALIDISTKEIAAHKMALWPSCQQRVCSVLP